MISNRGMSAGDAENHIHRMVSAGNYQWMENVRLDIRLSTVVKDPDATLAKVANYIQDNPGQSLSVTFFDDAGNRMQGIDAGGLTRHLITDLFEALPNSKMIQFAKLENGRVTPFSGATLSKKERDKWTQVGIVLAFCLEKNLLVGSVFEDGFFEALKIFDPTTNDFFYRLSVYKVLRKDDEQEIKMLNRIEALLKKNEWTEADFEEANSMINLGEDDDEPTQETLKRELRGFLSMHNQILDPMGCIAVELRRSSIFNKISAKEFLERVQGKIDKKTVLSRMNFSQDHPNESYLKRWVSESTDDELKALIKAATGSCVVGNTSIHVISSSGSMACFHTCGYQIDLPKRNYPDYMAFKAMLTLSVEYGLAGGFQTA